MEPCLAPRPSWCWQSPSCLQNGGMTMAEEKTPWNEDDPPINPKTHRRLLRFINAAQTSEDLLVAPNDRKVADEKLEHEHGAEHHHEEKQLLQRADAGALIEARDRV